MLLTFPTDPEVAVNEGVADGEIIIGGFLQWNAVPAANAMVPGGATEQREASGNRCEDESFHGDWATFLVFRSQAPTIVVQNHR